jgi:hypothetical protein
VFDEIGNELPGCMDAMHRGRYLLKPERKAGYSGEKTHNVGAITPYTNPYTNGIQRPGFRPVNGV